MDSTNETKPTVFFDSDDDEMDDIIAEFAEEKSNEQKIIQLSDGEDEIDDLIEEFAAAENECEDVKPKVPVILSDDDDDMVLDIIAEDFQYDSSDSSNLDSTIQDQSDNVNEKNNICDSSKTVIENGEYSVTCDKFNKNKTFFSSSVEISDENSSNKGTESSSSLTFSIKTALEHGSDVTSTSTASKGFNFAESNKNSSNEGSNQNGLNSFVVKIENANLNDNNKTNAYNEKMSNYVPIVLSDDDDDVLGALSGDFLDDVTSSTDNSNSLVCRSNVDGDKQKCDMKESSGNNVVNDDNEVVCDKNSKNGTVLSDSMESKPENSSSDCSVPRKNSESNFNSTELITFVDLLKATMNPSLLSLSIGPKSQIGNIVSENESLSEKGEKPMGDTVLESESDSSIDLFCKTKDLATQISEVCENGQSENLSDEIANCDNQQPSITLNENMESESNIQIAAIKGSPEKVLVSELNTQITAVEGGPERVLDSELNCQIVSIKGSPEKLLDSKLNCHITPVEGSPDKVIDSELNCKIIAVEGSPQKVFNSELNCQITAKEGSSEEVLHSQLNCQITAVEGSPQKVIDSELNIQIIAVEGSPQKVLNSELNCQIAALKGSPEKVIDSELNSQVTAKEGSSEEVLDSELNCQITAVEGSPQKVIDSELNCQIAAIKGSPEKILEFELNSQLTTEEGSSEAVLNSELNCQDVATNGSPEKVLNSELNCQITAVEGSPQKVIDSESNCQIAAMKGSPEKILEFELNSQLTTKEGTSEAALDSELNSQDVATKGSPEKVFNSKLNCQITAVEGSPQKVINSESSCQIAAMKGSPKKILEFELNSQLTTKEGSSEAVLDSELNCQDVSTKGSPEKVFNLELNCQITAVEGSPQKVFNSELNYQITPVKVSPQKVFDSELNYQITPVKVSPQKVFDSELNYQITPVKGSPQKVFDSELNYQITPVKVSPQKVFNSELNCQITPVKGSPQKVFDSELNYQITPVKGSPQKVFNSELNYQITPVKGSPQKVFDSELNYQITPVKVSPQKVFNSELNYQITPVKGSPKKVIDSELNSQITAEEGNSEEVLGSELNCQIAAKEGCPRKVINSELNCQITAVEGSPNKVFDSEFNCQIVAIKGSPQKVLDSELKCEITAAEGSPEKVEDSELKSQTAAITESHEKFIDTELNCHIIAIKGSPEKIIDSELNCQIVAVKGSPEKAQDNAHIIISETTSLKFSDVDNFVSNNDISYSRQLFSPSPKETIEDVNVIKESSEISKINNDRLADNLVTSVSSELEQNKENSSVENFNEIHNSLLNPANNLPSKSNHEVELNNSELHEYEINGDLEPVQDDGEKDFITAEERIPNSSVVEEDSSELKSNKRKSESLESESSKRIKGNPSHAESSSDASSKFTLSDTDVQEFLSNAVSTTMANMKAADKITELLPWNPSEKIETTITTLDRISSHICEDVIKELYKKKYNEGKIEVKVLENKIEKLSKDVEKFTSLGKELSICQKTAFAENSFNLPDTRNVCVNVKIFKESEIIKAWEEKEPNKEYNKEVSDVMNLLTENQPDNEQCDNDKNHSEKNVAPTPEDKETPEDKQRVDEEKKKEKKRKAHERYLKYKKLKSEQQNICQNTNREKRGKAQMNADDKPLPVTSSTPPPRSSCTVSSESESAVRTQSPDIIEISESDNAISSAVSVASTSSAASSSLHVTSEQPSINSVSSLEASLTDYFVPLKLPPPTIIKEGDRLIPYLDPSESDSLRNHLVSTESASTGISSVSSSDNNSQVENSVQNGAVFNGPLVPNTSENRDQKTNPYVNSFVKNFFQSCSTVNSIMHQGGGKMHVPSFYQQHMNGVNMAQNISQANGSVRQMVPSFAQLSSQPGQLQQNKHTVSYPQSISSTIPAMRPMPPPHPAGLSHQQSASSVLRHFLQNGSMSRVSCPPVAYHPSMSTFPPTVRTPVQQPFRPLQNSTMSVPLPSMDRNHPCHHPHPYAYYPPRSFSHLPHSQAFNFQRHPNKYTPSSYEHSQYISTLQPRYIHHSISSPEEHFIRSLSPQTASLQHSASSSQPATSSLHCSASPSLPTSSSSNSVQSPTTSKTPYLPSDAFTDEKGRHILPKPTVKGSIREDGSVVISWNLTLEEHHTEVEYYQIYSYQDKEPSGQFPIWKNVGDVASLDLPMACTLNHFDSNSRYHFTVRAVDKFKRYGPFSDPVAIFYQKSKEQSGAK